MQKVAVAVILVDGKLLLCQRKKGARYELKWEFPGGKVEEGESVEECVQRELKEELGIHAGRIGSIRTEISHYDDGSSYEVSYCYIPSFTGGIVNQVFEEVQWVTREQLRNKDILEGNRQFVQELMDDPLWGT
jgi:8-oxo-dGTP diphosphatase